MISATATCHEQSIEKAGKAMTQKKTSVKLKANCFHTLNKYFHALNECFYTLNKYNRNEALSEFRFGFLC